MGDSEPSVVNPRDLESYYRSIEMPFWVAWRSISHRDDPTGIFLFGFLLCLVPVFPFFASKLAGMVYGNPTIIFWHLRLQPSSFWLWWPVSATASFVVLMGIGRSQARLIEYRTRQLSPQQLRFAYCYGALDELRRYISSGVPEHIKTAYEYITHLGSAMMRASTLDLAEGAYPYHYWQSDAWVGRRKSGKHASVGIRLGLPSWYRLQPETQEIVKAFPRLTNLRERVVDSKDLAPVESALVDLAIFLYTEIANVPGAPPREVLERAGADSLLSFARKVNALPPYKRQPRKPEPRGRSARAVDVLSRGLIAVLTHENVIASFLGWYFLAVVLEIAILIPALKLFPRLSMDTTLLAAVTGTPLVVAASALVITKQRHNNSQS